MAKFKIVFAELFVCLLIIITSIFPAVTRATENPNLSIRINNIEGDLLENDEQISGFIESELQKEATADFSISLDEAKLIASEESQRNVVIIFNWENIEHPEHIAYSIFNQPAFSNGNVQVVKMSDNIETIDGEFIHLTHDHEKNYAYIVYSIELFDISSSDFIDMYGRMDDVESNHINFLIEGFDEPAEEPQVEISEVSVEDNLEEEANEDFILPVLKKEFMPQAVLLGTEADAGVTSIDSFQTSLIFGTKEISGKNVWVASRNTSGHPFVFRVSYSTSGIDKTPAGSYSIKIPKHILLDRNGEYADSFDIALLNENEVDENDRETEFVYREEGDYYVITNHIELSAAMSGYFEVYYATSEPTFNYFDMGENDPFVATFDINGHHAEAAPIYVYIDTTAYILYTDKRYPTIYTTWNDSWGTRPSDADENYYLVWEIKTAVTDYVTQPYNLEFYDDVSSEYGEVNFVGFRFSGQNTFSTNNLIENQKVSEYRYDYVLTSHKKSDFEHLDKYSVLNKIHVVLTPIDRIDEPTEAFSQKEFKWEKPRFVIPNGSLGVDIRADGSYRADKYSSTYDFYKMGFSRGKYSRYDLDSFKEGSLTSFDNFDYGTIVDSYSYIYTVNGDENNPADYGKKKVTTVLEHENFYLGEDGGSLINQKLVSDDFEIYKANFLINEYQASFDDASQSFSVTEGYSNEDTAYIYTKKTNVDSQWVLSGTIRLKDENAYTNSSDIKSISFAEGKAEVVFNSNVVAYKIEVENYGYRTRVQSVSFIKLKPSAFVMSSIEPWSSISIQGEVHGYLKDTSGNYAHTGTKADRNYARIIQKDSEIKKKAVSSNSDKKNRTFTITWSSTLKEQWTFGDGEVGYISQNGGQFYDLLPAGLFAKTKSVSVKTEDGYMSLNGYNAEVYENFNNTGRELLVITIKDPADYYQVYFDTVVDWDSISDYGKEVYNPIAYRTGNDFIVSGSNDDGGALVEKELMTNLTAEDDGNKFIYAESYYDIYAITAATSGLTKKVKTIDSERFVYDAKTRPDEDYQYRLRYMALTDTKVKNIVLFDSLENYVTPDTDSSDWRGTLQSIDVSQPTDMRAAPVIYLSSVPNLNIDENHDLSNETIWKEISAFGDISNAKAVAIDLSKNQKGEDFVIESGESISCYLVMKAPPAEDLPITNDLPITYNNVYALNTIINNKNHEEHDFFIRHDYTSIVLHVTGDVIVNKRSSEDDSPIKGITFRLFGTSDYGNVIDMTAETDNKGDVVFRDIEKGNYIVYEYKGLPDWVEDHTEHNVVIGSNSKTMIDGLDSDTNPLVVYNTPRVHSDFEFKKKVYDNEYLVFNDDMYDSQTMAKYAVSLYDIGVDKDENHDTMGLTFGPALGDNYNNSFVAHTVDQEGHILGKDAGFTDNGNAFRCIHHDSWEEIIFWNFKDPHVYDKCIKNKCTHSVYLDKTKSTSLFDYDFINDSTGDGPGTLVHTLNYQKDSSNRRWYSSGEKMVGWGSSRIRALLNGPDSNTITANNNYSSDTVLNALVYDGTNNLINAFPDILRAAIGKREVLYDSSTTEISENKVYSTNDKLWLLSINEIDYSNGHPFEAFDSYKRFKLTGTSSTNLNAYHEKDNTNSFWTRSVGSYQTQVYYYLNSFKTTQSNSTSGVSPCFTLTNNPSVFKNELNSISLDKNQRSWIASVISGKAESGDNFVNGEIPNVVFKLEGTSDYGTEVNSVVSSDSHGRVLFSDIEKGEYILTEMSADANLVIDSTQHTVVVDETGIHCDTLNLKDGSYILYNEVKDWDIRIYKRDSVSNTGLQGAVFTLKGTSAFGNTYDLTLTSDADGIIYIENIEKGKYILTEIEAPHGVDDFGHTDTGGDIEYFLDSTERILSIDETGSVFIDGVTPDADGHLVIKNVKKAPGKITIYKHWNYVDGDKLEEPTIVLTSEKPDTNQYYHITYHSMDGVFDNGLKTNTVSVYYDGKLPFIVDGVYKTPIYERDNISLYRWTYDLEGTQPYIASEPLTADIELYAQRRDDNYHSAYQIYAIGVDRDADNNVLGITFGPAIGDNYTAKIGVHQPSGTTSKGNKHRCIHNDSWEEIIEWNKVDPYVYEQCIQEECTKSVYYVKEEMDNLHSSYPQAVSQTVTRTRYGDGYGDSNLFNTYSLNGNDEEYLKYFDPLIANNMAKKKVVTVTDSGTTTTYDKLWLISLNNIFKPSQFVSPVTSKPSEGTQYARFAGKVNNTNVANTNLYLYYNYNSGAGNSFLGLRSENFEFYADATVRKTVGGMPNGRRASFCFTLNNQ